jgi:amino acid permease
MFTQSAAIGGMSIGASELGLPIVLRFSGYLPAAFGMLAVDICMLASGILPYRVFLAGRERRKVRAYLSQD